MAQPNSPVHKTTFIAIAAAACLIGAAAYSAPSQAQITAPLTLTASASTQQATPGEVIGYTFRLTNTSAVAVSGVYIQFFVTPPGARIINSSLPGGTIIPSTATQPAAIIWGDKAVPANGSILSVLSVQLPSSATEPTVEANVSATAPDSQRLEQIVSVQLTGSGSQEIPASPSPSSTPAVSSPSPSPSLSPSPLLSPSPSVAPPAPNRAPTIAGLPEQITLPAGRVYGITFTATDPDGDPITFSLQQTGSQAANFCRLNAAGSST